jgi:hypothetical protein
VELEFADRFEAAGAANRTEARIIAAATMAAIIAAMDDWQEATPAQPFVSAGAAAAASLRAVLNG